MILPKESATFSSCRFNFLLRFLSRTRVIGNWAFEGCSGLTWAIIPNSIVTIGDNIFSGCYKLHKGAYPNTIDNPIQGCDMSSTVCYPAEGAIIEDGFVYGPDKSAIYFAPLSLKGHFTIPESVQTIGNYAFYGCGDITSIEIPNSVQTIGEYAFNGCRGLTSIGIPNSVQTIGEYAFDNCYRLKKVEFTSIEHLCNIKFGNNTANPLSYTGHLFINGEEVTDLIIPESVTAIGYCAFYGCRGLTSVEIGNSVETIGSHAFRNCSNLTSVEVPSSVETIGSGAFSGCSGLTSVIYNTDQPISANSYIFDSDTYNNAELIIPEGTKEIFLATEPWNQFLKIAESDLGGIEDVISDGADGEIDYDAPYEVYNLNGIKVGDLIK